MDGKKAVLVRNWHGPDGSTRMTISAVSMKDLLAMFANEPLAACIEEMNRFNEVMATEGREIRAGYEYTEGVSSG